MGKRFLWVRTGGVSQRIPVAEVSQTVPATGKTLFRVKVCAKTCILSSHPRKNRREAAVDSRKRYGSEMDTIGGLPRSLLQHSALSAAAVPVGSQLRVFFPQRITLSPKAASVPGGQAPTPQHAANGSLPGKPQVRCVVS